MDGGLPEMKVECESGPPADESEMMKAGADIT
jgi:hypothetical protein